MASANAFPRTLRDLVSRYVGVEGMLLATALVVGLGAGLGAIAFRWLIDTVRFLCFEWLPAATAGLGHPRP